MFFFLYDIECWLCSLFSEVCSCSSAYIVLSEVFSWLVLFLKLLCDLA
jgi:hypothetical protein